MRTSKPFFFALPLLMLFFLLLFFFAGLFTSSISKIAPEVDHKKKLPITSSTSSLDLLRPASLPCQDPIQIHVQCSKIYKHIRCLVCQGQSIEDSNAPFAINLRSQVQDWVAKGFTPQQIYKKLERQHGPAILFDPPLTIQTLLLWGIPFTLLALSLLFYGLSHRKPLEK